MTKLKILIQGYAREQGNEVFASSTTTLIQENNINVLVDPGMDREKLLLAFKEVDIKVSDIDFIVLTHYHLDHSLLTGIFENAKILDNGEIYSWNGSIKSHESIIPKTHIHIIKTPGHDMFHCTVLVETEEYGRVGICGDVFWWMDDAEQKTDIESLLKHEDPYVKDKDQLEDSRNKVLNLCNYIIPGHGKMFKVEK